ncbi:hypothetical protein D9619_010985 [Psilocybe cf. subviscida]|uniref:NADP-dependent oxidoreductase domain-containing protein n=1 Tax=Psilocybe cf. subviscida TaxID=2480587 RepID=A0A8H5EZT0_9AGAR|nr:hypothetical protein D9619_010985 [Psilocybe cf. subviscida]
MRYRTGKRNQIFLATKFGARGRDSPDNSVEYMRACIEKSLLRMGIDYIDLFYVHRVDKNMPIETTIKAMAELVKEGKVRYLGLSEVAEGTLRRAHAIHPIAAIQVEYSPFCLEIEDPKVGLIKACRELGITVVAYAPLGKGMLTGLYKCHEDIPATDFRRLLPKVPEAPIYCRFSNENFPNILKLVEVLQTIGQKHNATAGQITLAWLLAQGPEIIPLPGTKTVKYLEENVGAFNVHLSDGDIQQIREVAAHCNASSVGDRYPAFAMPYLMVDTVPL